MMALVANVIKQLEQSLGSICGPNSKSDSIMYYCSVDLDPEFQCIDHMANTVMKQMDCAKAETFNNINVIKPRVIIVAFVDVLCESSSM